MPVTQGRTESERVRSRRNSTGKTNTSNDEKKILPHYLRASTSSCHDFCKHGRKVALETKEKCSPLKQKIAVPGEGKDLKNSLTLSEREKKPVNVLKASSNPKPELIEPNKPRVIKRVKEPNLSAPTKKIVIPEKSAIGLKKKHVAENLSSSPLNPSGASSVRRNRDNDIVKSNVTSKLCGNKALDPHTASLSSNSSKNGNPKAESPLKNQIEAGDPENVEEKILYVLETKPGNKNKEPTSKRTLGKQYSLSSSSMSSSPESLPSHEFFSEHDETENKEVMEYLKVEKKRSPRKGETVYPGDNCFSSQKLNFRKGKVVNIQSEIEGPSKFKFKQGSVSMENQHNKNDSGNKGLRRGEMGNGVSVDTEPKSKKFVLKHQEVQGKKYAQVLLNNVIEDTMNKLAETRKNKVKALVGAFETVISLQEKKTFKYTS